MSLILGILVGVLALTFLVALHELGHALAAKKNGVKLEEFGIGFPPAAFTFKTKTDKILPKGTPVSINWIPLGGFVKLQGEHDSDNKKGDYGAASFWGKTQILLAGVTVNWIITAVIFSVLSIFGLPKMIPNQFSVASDTRKTGGEVKIVQVVEGLPADKSGLKSGDQILKVNGQEITDTSDISKIGKKNAGKKIEFEIIRDGKTETKTIEVRSNNADGKGLLGILSSQVGEKIYSTWSVPIVGVGVTVQLTGEVLQGTVKLLADTFTGIVQKFSSNAETQKIANQKLESAGKSVAGPISIIGVMFPDATRDGLPTVLLFTALISLSLACMNILPIPALDGGRWLLTFIFRVILKKPLSAETEEKINACGVLAILALSIFIIILDLFKVF